MSAVRFTVGDREGVLDESAVRAELEAVLSSPIFADAPRLTRFLRFIVECSLAGRSAELKEYLVGTEVFDRPSSFAPQSDSVVRVEARRLRSKLCDYYSTEGRDHRILIEVPKGGYRPLIRNVGRLRREPRAGWWHGISTLRRSLLPAATIMVVLATAALLFWRGTAVERRGPVASIAVLPLECNGSQFSPA